MISIKITGNDISIKKNDQIVFSGQIKIFSIYFGQPVPENSEVNNSYVAGITNIVLNKVDGVNSLQTKEEILIDL